MFVCVSVFGRRWECTTPARVTFFNNALVKQVPCAGFCDLCRQAAVSVAWRVRQLCVCLRMDVPIWAPQGLCLRVCVLCACMHACVCLCVRLSGWPSLCAVTWSYQSMP